MPLANVTTTSSAAIPAGNYRALILQNLSDTDIYIGFSGPVSVAGESNAGVRIKALGGSLSLLDLPTSGAVNNGPIYAIHAGSGTKTLNWQAI